MPLWLETILEIVKITVPALIVFFTVHYLLKTYLEKQYQLRVLEYKQSQQKTTIPLRLQAYERLSLFCERISIQNLLLRSREHGGNQTAAALRLKLLITIQQEFEHNITQQLYVSEQLWQIIKISRDDTVTVINAVAEKAGQDAPSNALVGNLLQFLESHPVTSIDKALSAIKKEASLLM